MKLNLVRATALVALGVALAFALAACGGGGDSNGVASLDPTNEQTTTSSSNGSGEASPKERRAAELAFARCMRAHGVDMPDPVNGRFDLKLKPGDQKNAEEAQRACGPILQRVAPHMTEEQEAKARQAALDFAKCMREHGVDVPDPTFDENGGMTMRMPEGTRKDDPKVQEAQKACEPILRAARPGGPGVVQGSRS